MSINSVESHSKKIYKKEEPSFQKSLWNNRWNIALGTALLAGTILAYLYKDSIAGIFASSSLLQADQSQQSSGSPVSSSSSTIRPSDQTGNAKKITLEELNTDVLRKKQYLGKVLSAWSSPDDPIQSSIRNITDSPHRTVLIEDMQSYNKSCMMKTNSSNQPHQELSENCLSLRSSIVQRARGLGKAEKILCEAAQGPLFVFDSNDRDTLQKTCRSLGYQRITPFPAAYNNDDSILSAIQQALQSLPPILQRS